MFRKNTDTEVANVRDYFFYSIVLAFGLYIVPTNLYYVVIVSISAGIFLCIQKKMIPLLKLIASSAVGAFFTVVCYIPTFAGMGCMNLLRSERGLSVSDSINELGVSEAIDLLKRRPFDAIFTGLGDMANNKYVVKKEYSTVLNQYGQWIIDTINDFFIGTNVWFHLFVLAVLIIFSICIVIKLYQIRKPNKDEPNYNTQLFLSILVLSSYIITGVVPFVQSVLPPARTFTFLAVPMAIGLGFIFDLFISQSIAKRRVKEFSVILIAIFSVFTLFSSKSLNVCASNEKETWNAINATKAWEYDSFLWGPIFFRGQLGFHFDKAIDSNNYHDPEYAILIREQTSEDCIEEPYQTEGVYKDLPWEWIKSKMVIAYEDNAVIVYIKKEE